ncbi:MAG: hypothetical protein U0798_04230 [Gemmataceae bacterium]
MALLALSRHAIERSCEVKPYSSDLMMTVAILLATVGVLGHANRPRRQWAMGALLGLALFGPWISFPSVYFLGGAVAAVLLKSVLDRSRREAAWAFLTGSILLSSIGLLWYCHARHLYQDGLNQHFQLIGGFPDWTSRHGPFVWPITCFIDLGNYGTRNMGILLLIFACVGCRRFIRLNPSMAVVLCLPLLVAIAGTYFNKYPLSGRTTLFILPALWILATAGLTEISERFSTWRWVTLLPWILLASDVLGYASSMLKMPRTPAVREAIEYIHAHRQADDVIWGSHIEVYYVYSGQGDRVFGYLSNPQEVLRTANGGPIWLMEQPLTTLSYSGELIQHLNANGYRETLHHDMKGVIVSCMKKPTLPE